MPRFVIECPWCGEIHVFDSVPITCDVCGHRADLGRERCDCDRCRATPPRARAFLAAVLAGDRSEREESTR